uniref:Vacuolar protein-sorting-associated protein 36 n=1 Tax=Arcella intermedia TaxID=1963864 RepID=A0A6B2LBP6_9EUKA
MWRLTTHRILLCGQVKTESSAFQIQLGCVVGLTVKPHSWFQKSIHFTIHLNSENKATDVEVACLGGQRDLVVSKLRETLNAKHWETVPIYTLTRQKKADFDTKKAGIAGLIKEQEEKNKEIESTVSQAFTDLKALMSNAADMVALAKRLNTSTFTDKDELHQYRNILMDMGMSPSMSASNTSESKVVDIELVSSPVTKDLAGDLFHSELSRQIVDFVEKNALLKKNIGGKQILTDLYCIYNRARGTDLVSPNDFFEACLLFKKLGLPLRVSKLESGDYVVQHSIFFFKNEDGYVVFP